MSEIKIIERKVTVSRRIDRKKNRVYIYGIVKVNVPKEFIGRKAHVIVLV